MQTSGGGGAGGDHGALVGRGDDDHLQYVHMSAARTITAQHSFVPGSAQPPWVLGTNARSQLVVGLKADELNINVIAGTGLTGGGFLIADRTLNVGAGDGINVLADSVEVDVTDLIGAGIVEEATNHIAVGAGDGINVLAASVEVDVTDLIGSGIIEEATNDIAVGAGDGINVLTNSVEVDVTDLIGAGIVEEATNNIALGVPSTLHVSTTNAVTASSHTHAITSSFDPGATTSILKTNTSGYLQLLRIGLGVLAAHAVHIRDIAAPQFQLEYDSSNFATLSVASDGHLTISNTGFDADMTITVVDDLLVTANDINIDPSASIGITPGTFITIDPVAGNVTLAPQGNFSVRLEPTGNIFVDPGSTLVVPVDSYEVSLGLINKKYLQLHVAELWADTLVANETIATIGGRILVGPTTVLSRELTDTDTNIWVKHNQMASGDTVYMEKEFRVEFMAVTSGATEGLSLLSNDGFETAGGGGADIWANWTENAGDGTLTNETSLVKAGSDAVKMQAGPSTDTYIEQNATTVANTRYKLVFWTRGGGTNGGRFSVHDLTNGLDILDLRSTANATSTYGRKAVYFTTPNDCVSVRIRLQCNANDTGTCWFDGLVVYGGDPIVESMLVVAEFNYTVTRNLDGTGANDWEAGDAVFNTGNVGDGWMDLYSLFSVNADPAITTGPTIVGNIRQTTTFNDWAEHWAIGSLNGIYGQGAVYGAAFGEYATDSNHMIITGNSIKFFTDKTTQVATWINETITLGNVSGPHTVLTSSSIDLNDGGTTHIALDNVGNVYVGTNVDNPGPGVGFAIFTTGGSYNGETIGSGNILIGDNSSGVANLLWNKGDGAFHFRSGTTTMMEFDIVFGAANRNALLIGSNTTGTDGIGFIVYASTNGAQNIINNTKGMVIINAGTDNLTLNTATTIGSGDIYIGSQVSGKPSIFFDYSDGSTNWRLGTTTYAKLKGTTLTLGRTSDAYMTLDGTWLKMFDTAGNNLLQMEAGIIRIGHIPSGEYMRIDSDNINFFVSNISVADWTTGTIRLGRTTDAYMTLTGTEMSFFDTAGTKMTSITAGVIKLGRITGNDYIQIDAGSIDFRVDNNLVGVITGTSFRFGTSDNDERIEWNTTNGLRIINASNVVVLKVPTSGDAQILGTLNVDSPGVITAGTGVVTLDSGGIEIEATTSWSGLRSYEFRSGSNQVGGVRAHLNSSTAEVGIFCTADGDGTVTPQIDIFVVPTASHTTAILRLGVSTGINTNPTVSFIQIMEDADDPDDDGKIFIRAGDIFFEGSGGRCQLLMNTGANSNQDWGLTIFQETGGPNQEAITLRENGVVHNMAPTLTDTYYMLRELSVNVGGVVAWAFTESSRAHLIYGYAVTGVTSQSAGSTATIEANAAIRSGGGTGVAAAGNTTNIFAVRNNSSSRLIVTGNGTLWVDTTGVASAAQVNVYDDYDDIKLLAGARVLLNPEETYLQERFSDFIGYARPVLERAGVLTVNDGQYGNDTDGSIFMSVQGMLKLHNDAIRQSYFRTMSRIDQLEAALLDHGIEIPQLEGGNYGSNS